MSTFRFQHFAVQQRDAGMKICTDTVIFGAMMPLTQGLRVLDIGTGTGVLALMAAQLGAASVTAVELTHAAYAEAALNFNNSQWRDTLTAVQQSIQDFAVTAPTPYDFIISNPPFFVQHSKTQDKLRAIARHTDHLPFAELIAAVSQLLTPCGVFYVLLPVHAVTEFSALAQTFGLYLQHQTDIRGYAHNQVNVSALTFSRNPVIYTHRLLTIYHAQGVYSADSAGYLADFLLRFANN